MSKLLNFFHSKQQCLFWHVVSSFDETHFPINFSLVYFSHQKTHNDENESVSFKEHHKERDINLTVCKYQFLKNIWNRCMYCFTSSENIYYTGAPECVSTYCGQTKFVLKLVWTELKNRPFSWPYIQKQNILKALSQNMVWTSSHVHICSGALATNKPTLSIYH